MGVTAYFEPSTAGPEARPGGTGLLAIVDGFRRVRSAAA